jgi:hypothetical protein
MSSGVGVGEGDGDGAGDGDFAGVGDGVASTALEGVSPGETSAPQADATSAAERTIAISGRPIVRDRRGRDLVAVSTPAAVPFR